MERGEEVGGRVTRVEWGGEVEGDRGEMECGGERRWGRVKGIDWGGEVGG